MSGSGLSLDITPQVVLKAYACGIFPMAESADDPTLFWVEPEMRGVIPLDGFRIASRLARTVRASREAMRKPSSGITPRISGSTQNSVGSPALSAIGKMPQA